MKVEARFLMMSEALFFQKREARRRSLFFRSLSLFRAYHQLFPPQPLFQPLFQLL